MLATVEPIAAIHPLCFGRREQDGNIIARLGVTRGKYFSRCCFAQHPFQGWIPRPAKIGGYPHPIQVHIQSERSGWRMVCQTALLAANLRQGHPPASQLGRHRH